MRLSPSHRWLVLGLAFLLMTPLVWSLGRTSPVQAFAPNNLEFVSSLGGRITSVAPAGTIVFAGQGYALASFDASDPARITLLSRVSLPDFPVRVRVSGTNAYIADGAGGLQIVDIADPRRLQWRGSLTTNGAASDIAVVSNRAYVAVHSSSDTLLQLVDVTNPAAPTLLGSFSMGYGGSYAAVDVAGSIAFLGGASGLTIVDASNPVLPTRLGELTLMNGASEVQVMGDRVVTAGSGDDPFQGGFELDVIDVHVPASPTLVGSYVRPAIGIPGSGSALDVVGNLAYASGAEPGLLVIDLTVPTTPTLKSRFPFAASDIKVNGSRGFLASGSGLLQIVDFNAAPAASLIGQFELFADLFDVRLKAPYAFTTDASQILRVVDTSNPQSPVVIPSNPFPGFGTELMLDGNLAYVNGVNYGLSIFNIKTPSSPALLASYNPASHGSYTAVTAAGKYAYVGEGLGGTRVSGVNILDVSNPATPKYLTTIDQISGSGPQAMKAVKDILYIAAGNGGLVTLDVSKPARPSIIGRAGGFWAPGLDVANNLAFVAAMGDGMYIFDVRNPASPTLRGKYSAGNIPLGKVLAVGNRVFVAESGKGLLVLDVRNPSTPTLYQEYPLACDIQGFDVVDNYIYLACRAGGLRIYRLPAS